MKRDNRVSLDGNLWIRGVGSVPIDGTDALSVRCKLSTDQKHFGGHHPIVTYGRLATEVIAFAIVSRIRQEELEVSLDGWLWSDGEKDISTTVADGIVFRCDSRLRADAAQVLSQLLEGASVIFLNGKQYGLFDIVPELDYRHEEKSSNPPGSAYDPVLPASSSSRKRRLAS